MFVAPSWIEGYLIQVGMYIVIPLIIATIVVIVMGIKSNHKELHNKELHNNEAHSKEPHHKKSHKEPNHNESHPKRSDNRGSKLIIFVFAFVVAILVVYPIGCVFWFYAYEVPSIQEKTITVLGWEPRPGIIAKGDGTMVISNADQLLLVTTENEGFYNMENLFFQKFNTRDIFNQLKVGGTYKIKYYGWRNGYNSGFPNILSVVQVVNETGAKNNTYSDYFGIKFAV